MTVVDALWEKLKLIETTSASHIFDVDVTVLVDGNVVVDHHFTADGAVEGTSPVRVYCAGKPMFGFLLARYLTEERWDEPIAHLLGCEDRWGAASPWDLASHRAGFPPGPAALLSVLPPGRRDELIPQIVPTQPRGTVEYDQLVGWELARLVLELHTGASLNELVEAATADLKIDGIGLGGPAHRWHQLHDNDAVFPLVGEVTLRAPWQNNAGIGWTGSTRGLASLCQSLSICALPAFVEWRRRAFDCDAHYDASLERWCRLGGALMLGLSDHHFGDGWSIASFGHAGYQGAVWVGADPERRLVIAVNHDHIIDANRAVLGRRPAVLEAVHASMSYAS